MRTALSNGGRTLRHIGIAGIECFDGPCDPGIRKICGSCSVRPMKVYVGNEGRHSGRALMAEMGYGVLFTAHYGNPDRYIYYCLDNGAYGAWSSGRTYDSGPFERALEKLLKHEKQPDFSVIPDIVAGGIDSLEYSLSWLSKLPKGGRYYLAVQDGMKPQDLEGHLDGISGLFVGGTLDWKIKMGETWVKYAHTKGLNCHIGRAGTFNRILWASRIGADSIDSMSWARHDSYHILESANAQQSLTAQTIRDNHKEKVKE